MNNITNKTNGLNGDKVLKKSKFASFNNSYRITFTSLGLILLSFFIYLNSIAEKDVTKQKMVYSSIAKAFNIQGDKKFPLSQESVKGDLISVVRQNIIQNELLELQAMEGLKGDIEIMENKTDLIINLSNQLLFDTGKEEIKDSCKPVLTKIIKIINKIDNTIKIEGYTDNTPIIDTNYESNWELSAARATEVLKYMHYNGNIPMSRLNAMGYGEFHPIISNDTIRGREKNRRVAIVICNAKGLDELSKYGNVIKIKGFKFKAPIEDIDESY